MKGKGKKERNSEKKKGLWPAKKERREGVCEQDWLRNCQLSWYFWRIFPEGRADDYRSLALFSIGTMRRAALFANREPGHECHNVTCVKIVW